MQNDESATMTYDQKYNYTDDELDMTTNDISDLRAGETETSRYDRPIHYST